MFLNFTTEELSNYISEGLAVAPGMRNAKYNNFIVGNGDTWAINYEASNGDAIDKIISDYSQTVRRDSRQQRKAKSEAQLLEIVTKDSSVVFPRNSVLVPRAIRVKGRIYLADKPLRVSTNFIVYCLPNEREAELFASWMLTIFYQLNCEISSKNQDALRKMEIPDVAATYVPLFSGITDEQYQTIHAVITGASFLNLSNPIIREIDLVWAEIIFGSDSVYVLNEARRLLGYIATKRRNR